MNLKFIDRRVGEENPETLVVREGDSSYPLPSSGDRVRLGDELYHVYQICHMIEYGDDGQDEVHALVVPLEEATKPDGTVQYP